MKSLVIMAACSAVTACAHSNPATDPTPLMIATPDYVKENRCDLLGDVHGVSGLYGVFAAKALRKSRDAVFQQTRALGGNTVVWVGFNTPHGSTSADAFAYRCPR